MNDLFTPKQIYACHCHECGELWVCYETPCSTDEAMKAIDDNNPCQRCSSPKVGIVPPARYEELQREKENG
jgi:hypothetical protein